MYSKYGYGIASKKLLGKYFISLSHIENDDEHQSQSHGSPIMPGLQRRRRIAGPSLSSLVSTLLLLLWSASITQEVTVKAQPNDSKEQTKRQDLLNAATRLVEASLSGSLGNHRNTNVLEDDWDLLLGALFEEENETPSSIIEKGKQFSEASYHSQFQEILDISRDPDCLEREFDVALNQFDVNHAVQVFRKCRILVLRNVFDGPTLQQALPKFQQYVEDVSNGNILKKGTTTYGGDYFILKEDRDRYNYLLTRELVSQSPSVFANDKIVQILSHADILGDESMILNHAGIINASPGSKRKQYWHIDGEYVHMNDRRSGTPSGHDLPPFAINMFTPLINLKPEHGATEFCVATSWLQGIDLKGISEDDWSNQNPRLQKLMDFEWEVQHGHKAPKCPTPFARRPLLQKGDVVLFDYMMTHRGGSNESDELRSLMFAMYSRQWFRDTTFDSGGNNDVDCNDNNDAQCELKYLTKLTRFAVVERVSRNGAGDKGDEL